MNDNDHAKVAVIALIRQVSIPSLYVATADFTTWRCGLQAWSARAGP